MVTLNEPFKPSKRYIPYLIIHTALVLVICASASLFWLAIPDTLPTPGIQTAVLIAASAVFAALILWVVVWAFLYHKSVVYLLDSNEMTWKRGVLFRRTGIVPYNRITNVDIYQGPLMRIIGISHLQVDTAGGSAKETSEIKLEGLEDPEPIRKMIMDIVRGKTPSPAAVGTDYGRFAENSESFSEKADTNEIVNELKAIRKLLEERRQ